MEIGDFREILVGMLLAASDTIKNAREHKDERLASRSEAERDQLFRLIAILDEDEEL